MSNYAPVFIEVTNDYGTAPGTNEYSRDEAAVRIAVDRVQFGWRGPRQTLEVFLDKDGNAELHPHKMAPALIHYLASNLTDGFDAISLTPPESPVADYDPYAVFVIRAREFGDHEVKAVDITRTLI